MKALRCLKRGDVVDVIAPGFKTQSTEKEVQFLKSWGLVPRIPDDIFGSHFLHAQEDEVRFAHLRNALLASDSVAIWCLRGGYGSNRLVPWLDKMKPPKNNKWFLGISDITSLHVFLNFQWGWPTLHGPVLDRVSSGDLPKNIVSQVKKILFQPKDFQFRFQIQGEGDATGELVGGNLTVLQSLIGTPYAPNLKNKILVVEDLGERGYRVDRILEHMRQAGWFKGISALVFGDFIGGEEPKGRSLIPKVIQRWREDLPFPVYSGLKIGHGYVQWPIPFGVPAQIKNGVLTCSIKKKS